MSITLSKEGRRVYILGNTYPLRDVIRAAGGNWDADRKAWWVGTSKAEAIQEAIKKNEDSDGKKETKVGEETRVKGRVTYKSKSYYLLAQTSDSSRLLLCSRDASISFWADAKECAIDKRYGQENYRTGKVEYPTISSLKAYAAKAKKANDEGRDMGWKGNGCSECRSIQDWCKRCAFDEFDN